MNSFLFFRMGKSWLRFSTSSNGKLPMSHSLQFWLKKLFLYRYFLICFTHEKRPVTFPHENFSWLNRHFWKLNSEYYYTSAVPQTYSIIFFLKSKPMQYLWSLYCTVWFVFSPAQQQQCHKNSPKRDNDSLLCLTNQPYTTTTY